MNILVVRAVELHDHHDVKVNAQGENNGAKVEHQHPILLKVTRHGDLLAAEAVEGSTTGAQTIEHDWHAVLGLRRVEEPFIIR